MLNLDNYQILFIAFAFLFQLILVTYFALRRWRFGLAMKYGPIVYGLSLAFVVISIIIQRSGMRWYFWLAGFLYLIWAVFGYTIEYMKHIEWRNSVRWSILGPYVLLYLATVVFYWWPLALIYKPLWYAYAVLFVVSTYLNVTSHKVAGGSHLSDALGQSV